MTSLLKNIQSTYAQTGNNNVGPTADNSSRIALLKKVQSRTAYGDKKVSQLWGLNNLEEKGNKSGTGGDSGTRTYFVGIFPRMTF
jgi:hypothetical protein